MLTTDDPLPSLRAVFWPTKNYWLSFRVRNRRRNKMTRGGGAGSTWLRWTRGMLVFNPSDSKLLRASRTDKARNSWGICHVYSSCHPYALNFSSALTRHCYDQKQKKFTRSFPNYFLAIFQLLSAPPWVEYKYQLVPQVPKISARSSFLMVKMKRNGSTKKLLRAQVRYPHLQLEIWWGFLFLPGWFLFLPIWFE